MTTDRACQMCRDQMSDLVLQEPARLLAAPQQGLGAHLSNCTGCQAELARWQIICKATAVATDAGPQPSPDLPGAFWDKLEREINPVVVSRPAAAVRHLGLHHALQLLTGQLPLIYRRLWAASAVVMAVGVVFSVAVAAPSTAAGTFGLVAPAIAAIGIALVYGPEVDPGLELALATPTSPRSVLLARMTLVLGYDLGLALTANAVITIVRDDLAWWGLIGQWLGPMLLLASMALLVSVIFRPTAAITAALVLWTIRLVTLTDAGRVMADGVIQSAMNVLWSTSPTTLVTVAAVLTAAVSVVGRRQRLT